MHSQHPLHATPALLTSFLSPSLQVFLCHPHYVARTSLLVASRERRREGSKSFEIPHVSEYLYSTLYLKIASQ